MRHDGKQQEDGHFHSEQIVPLCILNSKRSSKNTKKEETGFQDFLFVGLDNKKNTLLFHTQQLYIVIIYPLKAADTLCSHFFAQVAAMNLSCASCTFWNAADAIECAMCQQSFTERKESPKVNKRNFEDIRANPTSRNISAHPSTTATSQEKGPEQFLTCPQCTLRNTLSDSVCALCDYSFDDSCPQSGRATASHSPRHATDYLNHILDKSTSEVMQDGLMTLLESALQEQMQVDRLKKRPRQQDPASTGASSAPFRLCSLLTPHITQQGVQEGELAC
jgi:hypothetical protein